MQVTIEINGRQALPVRAIPLLTDWRGLSPDQLAQILAGDSDHWPSFDGLTAYRLHPDGSTEPIPPRWWASWVVGKLQATSEAIEAKQTSHATGRQQWRSESLAQLPAGVFLWRDEFEAAHAREYGPKSLRARFNPETFDPSAHALDFSPYPDPDVAPEHLVLEGFVPNGDAGGERFSQALEWLNAPREELPQEHQDAFALWCEIDAIDQQVRELETTQPVGVTEILARRAALKELHAERAHLLALLDGQEQPAQGPESAPTKLGVNVNMVSTTVNRLSPAEPAPVAPPLNEAPTPDEPAPDEPMPKSATTREKRITWMDVAGPYIAGVIRDCQCATAKELFRVLEERAGPNSPFDKGRSGNRASLFVREIGQPVALKTMQTNFKKLREMARNTAP